MSEQALAQAKSVIDEIAAVVQSVGCKAEVVGAEGGVLKLRLERPYHVPEESTVRIRHFVERELREALGSEQAIEWDLPVPESPFQRQPEPEEDAVEIKVITPPEDSDTCILTLDRPVVTEGTLMFDSAGEAQGHPLFQRLLGVPGVSAVMGKDRMLIVSREGGAWPALIEALKSAIHGHYSSGDAAADGPVDEQLIWSKVWKLLDEEVNPAVAMHGGVIQLLEVRGRDVYLHMGGGCQGCGAATVTLRQGVERSIREKVPEVANIYDNTDHGAGENPYYST